MFTGLVETVGSIARIQDVDGGRSIDIRCEFARELKLGDSVSIDGVCMTAASLTTESFTVHAIEATLSRTTVGEWAVERPVNLERAMRAGDRLGGHFVQGHVDATGSVVNMARSGTEVLVDVQLPPTVAEVTILHGSITIDGVSLTVSELPAPDVARVALIPYTWTHTNLSRLQPGAAVNLEGDMLGRQVVAYLKRTNAVR